MSYVALDFETASSSRSSACALAMVRFEDSRILDEIYTLLSLPGTYFDPFNVGIHGIHPCDCKNAPTFDEIWEKVYGFIGDSVVIAHNAGFDLGVLKHTLAKYGMEVPHLRYYCTWKLSKILYPDLKSRALDALANRINFKFEHHNALEDAKACAAVFHRMEEELAPESIFSVMKPKLFLCQ